MATRICSFFLQRFLHECIFDVRLQRCLNWLLDSSDQAKINSQKSEEILNTLNSHICCFLTKETSILVSNVWRKSKTHILNLLNAEKYCEDLHARHDIPKEIGSIPILIQYDWITIAKLCTLSVLCMNIFAQRIGASSGKISEGLEHPFETQLITRSVFFRVGCDQVISQTKIEFLRRIWIDVINTKDLVSEDGQTIWFKSRRLFVVNGPLIYSRDELKIKQELVEWSLATYRTNEREILHEIHFFDHYRKIRNGMKMLLILTETIGPRYSPAHFVATEFYIKDIVRKLNDSFPKKRVRYSVICNSFTNTSRVALSNIIEMKFSRLDHTCLQSVGEIGSDIYLLGPLFVMYSNSLLNVVDYIIEAVIGVFTMDSEDEWTEKKFTTHMTTYSCFAQSFLSVCGNFFCSASSASDRPNIVGETIEISRRNFYNIYRTMEKCRKQILFANLDSHNNFHDEKQVNKGNPPLFPVAIDSNYVAVCKSHNSISFPCLWKYKTNPFCEIYSRKTFPFLNILGKDIITIFAEFRDYEIHFWETCIEKFGVKTAKLWLPILLHRATHSSRGVPETEKPKREKHGLQDKDFFSFVSKAIMSSSSKYDFDTIPLTTSLAFIYGDFLDKKKMQVIEKSDSAHPFFWLPSNAARNVHSVSTPSATMLTTISLILGFQFLDVFLHCTIMNTTGEIQSIWSSPCNIPSQIIRNIKKVVSGHLGIASPCHFIKSLISRTVIEKPEKVRLLCDQLMKSIGISMNSWGPLFQYKLMEKITDQSGTVLDSNFRTDLVLVLELVGVESDEMLDTFRPLITGRFVVSDPKFPPLVNRQHLESILSLAAQRILKKWSELSTSSKLLRSTVLQYPYAPTTSHIDGNEQTSESSSTDCIAEEERTEETHIPHVNKTPPLLLDLGTVNVDILTGVEFNILVKFIKITSFIEKTLNLRW